MHAKRYDRTGKSVVFRLWIKPQTNGFHESVFVLYFVAIGSFTTDGGLLQPTGVVKTTPQKTRSQCESPQGIRVQVKIEYMNTVTRIKIDDMKHRAKPKTMCEVTWNTWGTCVLERSWCQCMSLHALKILRFRSLSFCFQLLSLSFDCLPS